MATISEALAIAIAHHQAGRLAAAEQIYRQVLEIEPNHADALNLLGMIAHQVGRHDVAVECLTRAITVNGREAGLHNNLGNVYRALNRLPEAVVCFRRALELRPDYAEAHNNLGNVLVSQGRQEEAVGFYHRAVQLMPRFAEAHDNLGLALKELGRIDEAIACYTRAVELRPDYAEARSHLGAAFMIQGKLAEAGDCLRRALELKPEDAETHNNIGIVLTAQSRLDEAAASFRRAVALRPDYAEAYSNLGTVCRSQEKLGEAIACFERALALKPDLAAACSNLGIVFRALGKLEEAAAYSRRAIELNPESADVHVNLGNVLRDLGRLDEAAACLHRAIELDPALTDAHVNLGLVLLLQGRYEEGWREYERRVDSFAARGRFSRPRWSGGRAEGQTILIRSEQGFGDLIQLVRYAPLVREQSGARQVLLETHPPLARLFQQVGGWGAEVVPGWSSEEEMPPIDREVSLLSLPLALGRFAPLQMSGPYLRADEGMRQVWRERIGVDSSIRVGLAWAGSPVHKADRARSMDPERFLPLVQMPGFTFYSLQVGSKYCAGPSLEAAGLIDFTTHISDFADTAAFVAELDLIISVDTAVVHLAGAMGRPVWVLLPFQGEWRWGMAGETTPWYPTMRLFRQATFGDWSTVVRRIAVELERFVNYQDSGPA